MFMGGLFGLGSSWTSERHYARYAPCIETVALLGEQQPSLGFSKFSLASEPLVVFCFFSHARCTPYRSGNKRAR
jgi:hypothetical protein